MTTPEPAPADLRFAVPFLRLEGLAVLAAAVAMYAHVGRGWGLFALLFLAPDLSMLGYLAGPRVGAWTYNLAHTYVAPLVLAAAALPLKAPVAGAVALVWLAHLGFDRMLGYGLKLPTSFQDTHLGRIGPRARR